MRVLASIRGDQCRLGLYQPLVPSNNPTSDNIPVACAHAPAKSNPEFGCERFGAASGHGLGHRFIENGTDHASMDDSSEAFPHSCRSPPCRRFGAASLKSDSQSAGVGLPANKAARLREGAKSPSWFVRDNLLCHDSQPVQTSFRSSGSQA